MKLQGIIVTIVIIAIVFYMWKKGLFTKLFGNGLPFTPHYTPIPLGGKYVKISVAASATDLYNAMEQGWWNSLPIIGTAADDKDKVWGRYNALPNDAFIAVYNGFNKMYEQQLGRTLTEEIAGQWRVNASVFSPTTNALRDGIIERLRSLNCI
jgi:hypothetical protein